MSDVHLRLVDLNLLSTLYALLEERQVTRAAKRCFLSQPAMSRSLERIRDTFGDELLIRTGRIYERTVRGEWLLRELENLLPRLEALVRGEPFDPAQSRKDSGGCDRQRIHSPLAGTNSTYPDGRAGHYPGNRRLA